MEKMNEKEKKCRDQVVQRRAEGNQIKEEKRSCEKYRFRKFLMTGQENKKHDLGLHERLNVCWFIF